MFASNTGISTSHNITLVIDKGEMRTFRVLLRPEVCGRLTWRFRFSNCVDSTWADGSESWVDMPGGRFEIVSCVAGVADAELTMSEQQPVEWPQRVVEPLACLTSAEVTLNVPQGGYLAFSWCVRALEDHCVLPCTPDSRALCWCEEGDQTLKADNRFSEEAVMLPDCFEADRNVRMKMVFMGDSITQGCQTGVNAYEQWATRIAMGMERKVSVWNIGLGYGRATDAAKNGAWLRKAAQADVVNICFGVNDILHGVRDADKLTEALREIIAALHRAQPAIKVVLFTVPPFDLTGKEEEMWRTVNARIRGNQLGADFMFDFAALLGEPAPRDNYAMFGGHPDGRGGALVAGEYLSHFWPMTFRQDFALHP